MDEQTDQDGGAKAHLLGDVPVLVFLLLASLPLAWLSAFRFMMAVMQLGLCEKYRSAAAQAKGSGKTRILERGGLMPSVEVFKFFWAAPKTLDGASLWPPEDPRSAHLPTPRPEI